MAQAVELAHHEGMNEAMLATAAWVVLVFTILALFGSTSGGAWSIAGSVARGVRDWSGGHAAADAAPSAAALSTAEDSKRAPIAVVDDLGDRPLGRT